jgi:hypothetical protein
MKMMKIIVKMNIMIIKDLNKKEELEEPKEKQVLLELQILKENLKEANLHLEEVLDQRIQLKVP